jgi:hypothetical protein
MKFTNRIEKSFVVAPFEKNLLPGASTVRQPSADKIADRESAQGRLSMHFDFLNVLTERSG